MKAAHFIAVAAISAVVTGCASQSQTIRPADTYDVTTTRVVKENFDSTWERMVGNLSKSFFVINNIEKDSRIINVSFSTDNPGQYVDCGEGTITVNDTTRTVQFTENATYPYVYQKGAYKYEGSARRRTSLEGRVNIYMQPKGSETTEVSANAKYVMSATVKRFTNTGQMYYNDTSSTTFQSKEGSQFADGQGVCRSKGSLEEAILDMARDAS